MMYGFKLAMQNLIRHRWRNIVSCILLTAAVSVIFCAAFFDDTAEADTASLNDRYSKRFYIGFRKELTDFPVSVLGADGNYYYDESLAAAKEEELKKYDRPYPMSLDMYETLAASDFCTDAGIAYADTAYGFTDGDLPEWMREYLYDIYSFAGFSEDEIELPEKLVTEHTVVGGDIDAFSQIVREFSGKLFGFVLSEGEEPGRGECVITDYYASLYGKGVGDTIPLYDIDGNQLTSMTVSGISKVYSTTRYDGTYPDYPDVSEYQSGSFLSDGFRAFPMTGTPHDRLGEYDAGIKEKYPDHYSISAAMLTVIITDLDTVYNLYGTAESDPEFEERHHFNNFFAVFDLADGSHGQDFAAAVHEVMPEEFSDEFEVYTFESTLDDCLEKADSVRNDAKLLYRLSVPLAVFIFITVSLFLIRERKREIGIYLSLGMGEWVSGLITAAENTVIMVISAAAASFGGYIINKLISAGYSYFEVLGKSYSISQTAAVSAGVIVLSGFVLTSIFTSMYIRIKSPIRLIRQE